MGRHFIWSASGLYFTSRTYLPISCHWSLFMPLKNVRKPLVRPVTWNVLTRMFLNRVTQSFKKIMKDPYCVKSVHIWNFSGPYFPTFGVTIQSGCGKILSRKTPNTYTFHAVPYDWSIHLIFLESLIKSNIVWIH